VTKKHELIRATTFGHRIAEEEREELSRYFVETEQWREIYDGRVDIVYGAKGAGKSAIYALLLSRRDALFDRGIIAVGAENPRGTPAFKDLVQDPPTGEAQFRDLWKLYFLTLLGSTLRDYGLSDEFAQRVLRPLEDAGLLDREAGTSSLGALLKRVLDYVRAFAPESVEGGIEIDPVTGGPTGVKGRITLREPSTGQRKRGFVSVDALLAETDRALGSSGFSVWLLLDRLDVAFADTEALEGNALRALFRVYLDLASFEHVSLKIFLRSDIWRRIKGEGFREASHLTRTAMISWDHRSLLNLIVRRAVQSESLCDFYNIDVAHTLQDARQQEMLFGRMFPEQVERGEKRRKTLDWMISRTQDGTREPAPRELIHLISAARDVQLRSLELGHAEPAGEEFLDGNSLKEALPQVSKVRYEQTLLAEYPSLEVLLSRLEREKTVQTPETLSHVWGMSRDKAVKGAADLVEVGFFEERGSKQNPKYWVPFVYRAALSMVQGSAEVQDDADEEA